MEFLRILQKAFNFLILTAFLTFFGPVVDHSLSSQAQTSENPIVGGGLVPIKEGEDEDTGPPLPPPDLEPILPVATPKPPVIEAPVAPPAPPPSLMKPPSERVSPPVPSPDGERENRTVERDPRENALSQQGIVVERQKPGGPYLPDGPSEGALEAGDRLRWRYPRDEEWRILQAYDATSFKLLPHHYEIGGSFFHSFRQGNNRIQIPRLEEAKIRETNPDSIPPSKSSLKVFVQVNKGSPPAPPPDGNCVVWENGTLKLSDMASGEIDTQGEEGLENLGLSGMTEGMIYGLKPPSSISLYAVRLDFMHEIFEEIGRKKGRSDIELAKLTRLFQLADSPSRQKWCEARIDYESRLGSHLEERRHYYQMFLRGDLDSITLIRSNHPMPHIQIAEMIYRRENLELQVGLFSDQLGEVLLPANAILWINEALPVTGSPFTFEITDNSEPGFVGYDTRFRSEGGRLVAETRLEGGASWTPRNVTVDLYRYASFRPPQPELPPEYLLDLTVDLTGGLTRLGREMIATGRLGFIRLTQDSFRIDVRPELLVSPVPMDNVLRNVIIGPLELRPWLFGRRSRIREAFDDIPIIPERVWEEFENGVDELTLRAHEIQIEKRKRDRDWVFEPAALSLALTKLPIPGQFQMELSVETADKNVAKVNRTIQPEIDLTDFIARSVALNRETTDLQSFRALTETEWWEMQKATP